MTLIVLLIAQAAATLGAPAEAFDLRTAPADCGEPGNEIVVCGRKADDDPARLRPLPERYAPAPVRATVGLGAGTLGIEGEQAVFPDGTTSNRLMLKLKMPF